MTKDRRWPLLTNADNSRRETDTSSSSPMSTIVMSWKLWSRPPHRGPEHEYCKHPSLAGFGFPSHPADGRLVQPHPVLNQLQDGREVVIAYASRSLRLSQRRYCTTCREMLAAVVMCMHFRLYLRGAQFILRTDHSSLRWLQKFRNEDGMLAHWYLLLGQFSVTFEYRPGAQHANADGMSRQCGQCQRPDCPVSASDSQVADRDVPQALEEQPFASSEMGESMHMDLLPELSGETWVADLLLAGADLDLIVASRQDRTLATVREWVQSSNVPLWADCAGLSPELRCWRLQVGNLSIDTDGRLWRRRAPPSGASQLVVPHSERRDMIRRFHDSLFAGHLGVSRTVFRFKVVCTGRVCIRMSGHTWHPVLSVWLESLRVHGGLPWDMSQWVIDGIEWRWTCWTCRLHQPREIVMNE